MAAPPPPVAAAPVLPIIEQTFEWLDYEQFQSKQRVAGTEADEDAVREMWMTMIVEDSAPKKIARGKVLIRFDAA